MYSSVITRVQMTVSEHYKPQGFIILAGTKVNTNQIMKYLNRIAFQLISKLSNIDRQCVIILNNCIVILPGVLIFG